MRAAAERALAGAAALACAAATAGEAKAANPRPFTIPAVREWQGTDGSFALRRSSRIVVERRSWRRLRPEAVRLSRDLRAIAGRRLPVVRLAGPTRRGDIVVKSLYRLPVPIAEGHSLEITRSRVRISARSAAGAFAGTRTLLQLLAGDGRAPAGTIIDWPSHPERGLMLDIGRRYFTPAWLERRIREMAYLKLNLLHLHFSENEGFRIESRTHPEIVSAEHLTRAQVRRLVAVAAEHHITVVPEIDAPGHMRAALAPHPELQLRDAAGRPQSDKLDVTSPEARRFVADLIGEYLSLFPGPYWHTGADEYLGIVSTEASYEAYPSLGAYAREHYGPEAKPKDAVIDFVNWVGSLVRARGRTLRVWSDGIEGGSAARLDPSTVVEWWENMHSAPPAELIARGHRVLNAGWWPTYYVTGGPVRGFRADAAEAYENWDVAQFHGPYTTKYFTPATPLPPAATVPPGAPALLGSKLHVWNDVPAAEHAEQIEAGIAPRLRLLAQKAWGSPPVEASYEGFVARTPEAGTAPDGP